MPRPSDRAGRDDLFLFVHVPKTGGQTLLFFFMKALVEHREFVHWHDYGFRRAEAAGLPPFEDRPLEERMRARVILGHSVTCQTHRLVPGKIPRHVVFLRDPAATLVSYYNYQMHERRGVGQPIVDFESWYDASKRGSMMTRWLYVHFMQRDDPGEVDRRVLDEVNRVLHGFWFVGCTELMDRDIRLLLRRIGVRGRPQRANVTGVGVERFLSLDPALHARLSADNALDVELYAYWRARLADSRARLRRAPAWLWRMLSA